jgi:hypothetical protein
LPANKLIVVSKILAIAFSLLALASVCTAQTNPKLLGKIINSRNEPVSGATVSLVGENRQQLADAEGRFGLNLISGKRYSIRLSSAGYSPKLLEDVILKDGEELFVTVVLETKSELGEVIVKSSVRRETTTALILSGAHQIARRAK